MENKRLGESYTIMTMSLPLNSHRALMHPKSRLSHVTDTITTCFESIQTLSNIFFLVDNFFWGGGILQHSDDLYNMVAYTSFSLSSTASIDLIRLCAEMLTSSSSS